jgi:hypothetical protein
MKIANFRLPIADLKTFGLIGRRSYRTANRQSAIGNRK